MKLATVQKIILNDNDPNTVNSIIASTQSGGIGSNIECFPMSLNFRQIPIIGEQVYVVGGFDSTSSANSKRITNYYISPISLQSNINHNSLPKLNYLRPGRDNSIQQSSAGIPAVSSTDSKPELGNGFVESPSVSQLQSYLGDVIFEGRFGQSIRFGYTPKNVKKTDVYVDGASIEPSWSSTKPESPITIFRNGAGLSRGYNKFVVEDINKDDTSIWMCSQQQVGIKLSQGISLSVQPANIYNKPQLIITSDRLTLNSRNDNIILSGGKGVHISTPNWKTDMDKMFSQIEELNNQLIQLNRQVQLLIAPLNPIAGFALTPIATQILAIDAKLAKVTGELTLMKQ